MTKFAKPVVLSGAALLLLSGLSLVVWGTVYQMSGRYIFPRESVFGQILCCWSGVVAAFGLVLPDERRSGLNDSPWMRRISTDENQKNIRVAALAIAILMCASWLIKGSSAHSIAPVQNVAAGILVNLLISILGSVFFGGFVFNQLSKWKDNK